MISLQDRVEVASRHALLIGISTYGEGLQPLPSALLDVEAMREVLANPELGDIPPDQLKVLINPDRTTMERAIETLFSNKAADDLLLFYFSGHGIQDPADHQLLLSTTESQYTSEGGIPYSPVVATTLPASIVRRNMDTSLSKCQIVILDCCFSGAFAWGMTIDKGVITKAFGGNGRAVLTSSKAAETSRAPASGDTLSVYTRFLVDGIRSGKAATNGSEEITTKELHDYALSEVQKENPSMTPQFYSTRDGYRIKVCKARRDPRDQYRQRVLEYLRTDQGVITPTAREFLNILQRRLGLEPNIATQIEAEAEQPYQTIREHQEKYRKLVRNLVQERGGFASFTNNDWRDLGEVAEHYGLPAEDVKSIHDQEEASIDPPKVPAIIKHFKLIINTIRNNKNPITIFLTALALVLSVTYLATPHVQGIFNALSCRKAIGDQISEGEEILIPDEDVETKQPMDQGSHAFRQCQYSKAFDYYKVAWKADRTKPEQLIYMNNAMLDSKASILKHYTIVVSISVNATKADAQNGRDYSNDFAREILRGVAQIQTKINLGLLSKNNSLSQELLSPENVNNQQPMSPKYVEFPIQKGINGMGLKVIIINDSNDKEKAKQVAKEISKQDNVLGVVGHYASDMSIETFGIYKDHKIAMVSPGSTSSWFTNNSNLSTNFFRTVFSGRQQSPFIAEFLRDQAITNIVALYSKESAFAKLFYKDFIKIFKAEPFNGKTSDIANQERLGQLQEHQLQKITEGIEAKQANIANTSKNNADNQLGIVIFPSPIGSAKQDALRLVNANRSRNWMIGTWGLRTNETLQSLDPQSRQRFVIAVPWDPWTADNRSFLEDSKILWGTQSVQPITALAYDASQVLVQAIKQVKDPSPEKILNRLKQKDFILKNGATGDIQFNENRDRTNPHVEFVHILPCASAREGAAFFPIGFKATKC